MVAVKLSFILVAIILVVSVAVAQVQFIGKREGALFLGQLNFILECQQHAGCRLSAQYGQPCAELTTGQYEIVQQKYTQATNAGYDSQIMSQPRHWLWADFDGSLVIGRHGREIQRKADCALLIPVHATPLAKPISMTFMMPTNAIDNGFTGYSDWLDAQALGYSQDNTSDDPDLGDDTSDAELWAEAKGNSIQTACQAEIRPS